MVVGPIGRRRWRIAFVLWMLGLVLFPVATLLVLVWDVPALALTIFIVNAVVLTRMITPPGGGK